MPGTSTSCVERPPIAFRLGVTGAAALDPEALESLGSRVAAVLAEIRDQIEICKASALASRVYDQASPPLLRVVSPLADGADRLVASAALTSGFVLETAFPFEQDDYESRFASASLEEHAASIQAFRTLLASAGPRVLVLDGTVANDLDRARSYQAIGRLVVHNCDLLIAIWDNAKLPHGRGGTTDTVHYALRAGVPVWWIHSSGERAPRWLMDTHDLGTHSNPTNALSPERELRDYISGLILPPEARDPEPDSRWRDILVRVRRQIGVQEDPLLRFLSETGRPNRKLWNAHSLVLGALRRSGRLQQEKIDQEKPSSCGKQSIGSAPATGGNLSTATLDHHLSQRQRIFGTGLSRFAIQPFRFNTRRKASSIAAELSANYQHRYRSSYMVVFICGAFALISAAIGLAFDEIELFASLSELIMLTTIGGLVFVNRLLGWHERYISYRILGELLRLSEYLDSLAWSVPGFRVNQLARSTQRNWVAWFFAAKVRATPMQAGSFDLVTLVAAKEKIQSRLLAGQIQFHRQREEECRGASAILGRWGRRLFLLTLAVVMIKLVMLFSIGSAPSWIALFGALLPAASAAFFGIRAYEELEVLAEQSEQMYDELSIAQARINRVRLNRPLASQVLGAELFAVAAIMLSDITGWAQLFRMKAVEA